MILRPYQAQALADLRATFASGAKRVLFVCPTGGGKTVCAGEIIRSAVARGRRVAFVVRSRALLAQGAGHLARVGISAGVVAAGEASDPLLPVQVCSAQTLTSRGNAPPADLLIWDEAHGIVAPTAKAIVELYPRAHVIGLTATPERGDGASLGDVFEVLVPVRATFAELVAAGALCPADVVGPSKRVDTLSADPAEAFRQWSNAGQRKGVVFARDRAHSRDIAESLVALGVPTAYVDGETPADERARLFAALASGELRCLTNCDLLTEGWDCPSIEVVVLARGFSSASTYLQAVGRVLRAAPGKTRALVVDLLGVTHTHGLPDEEREYSLTGRAIRPKETIEPIRQCGPCGAVFRSAVACPRCGAVRAPDPPRVEVRTIEQINAVSTRTERNEYLRELQSMARARGYHMKWVGVKFKEKYGAWPTRGVL